MIVVTTPYIVGKRITRTFGLARGNTVRAKHIGRDILAAFRNIVGGEIHEYTKLMAQSREQALDRMVEEAQGMGANAIVEMRFTTAEIASNVAEIMAYGTAVWVEDET